MFKEFTLFLYIVALLVPNSNESHQQRQQNYLDMADNPDRGLQIYSDKSTHQQSMKERNEDSNIDAHSSRFKIINEWKHLDFEYPTFSRRKQALATREFIPKNNLPLGIDFYQRRLFITTPRWKDGVPASINYLPFPPLERSPALRPYPNWKAHADPRNPDCSKLISVYRSSIDQCGRVWLIDSGIVNATIQLSQICPPKIVAYDLSNDQMLLSYEFPAEQVKEGSLHSNILADLRDGQCHDAYIYVCDVWRFGLVVYSLAKNRSWRVTNFQFFPNPLASDFNVYGLNFQWLDGIFGISLIPEKQQENFLYFHPLASFKEFAVSTNLLHDESVWPSRARQVAKYFVEIGDRGINGQSSTVGVDGNGVMFFTQVHHNNIGCWNMNKPYIRENLVLLLSNQTELIQFPNDLKIDQEIEQGVWIMSNRLPIYLYDQLNYSVINFRILRANVKGIVRNTKCDPTLDVERNVFIRESRMPIVFESQCY